jgi:hypothetical protein
MQMSDQIRKERALAKTLIKRLESSSTMCKFEYGIGQIPVRTVLQLTSSERLPIRQSS